MFSPMISQPPPPLLAGKVLVIIGGTTGIGRSAARAFVAAGARVMVVGRDPESTGDTARELGEGARALCGDASRPDIAPAAIRGALAAFGGFHGLYHVAGGSGRRWGDGPLHEVTDEGWSATLELNLNSVFFSNRAAARQFLEQGGGGTVLNLGSVLAASPAPRFFATHAYTAAKSAIVGLTRASASYYAAANIRFNVLAPGLVATPMSRRAREDPEIVNFATRRQPLDGGRVAQPGDLDAAAIYFMGDASRFTTGQVLSVDGGWSVSDGHLPPTPGAPKPADDSSAA
jgi:NAD(P)-dependent dehydrogenase (short-subunit alcohol dehydrogenase family)